MKFLSDILAKAGLVVDGTVTLNSVANATTDTDRFIVVDSGVVKYRTGTQLLSDIGGISGNQTITLSGDATGSGTTSIAVTLANSGVTAGTYGSSTAVPVITVDAKGRVTGVTTASISGSLTFTGDVTGSGTTGTTTTLTLANSGVTAGTYTKVTVDAKGRVTSGTTISAGDIPTLNQNTTGSAGSLSDDSGYIRTRSGGAEANLDTYVDNGVRTIAFTGYGQHLLSWNVGSSPGTIQQLFHYNTPSNGWKIRNKTDNTTWSSWGYVVMSSSNQGLISGTIATQSWVQSQGYLTSVSDVWVNNSGDSMTGNLSFGSSGAGVTWSANTDGASITFESTGDGASGGRALSNLLIALTDNGDEGLKVTTTGAELLYVNTNQFQYKGNTIWHSANDGSGSGLDADLLDGINSGSFLRSDVVDATVTGTILSTNNANVDGANFEVDTTNKTVAEYAYKVSRSGSAVGGILIDGRGAFATGTTVNGSTVWHAGNLTNLNQLTNGPGYITSYTETDTLQSVVSRGRTAAVGNTSYTGDGIYDAAATPVTFSTPHSSTTRIGYHDGGGGQYAATIGFLNTDYYSGLAAIRSRVSGEANDRFTIYHSGQIAWGAGGASGLDTNLYRDSADVLRTDDSFVSSVGLTVLRNLGTDNYSTVGQHNMHLRLRKSSLDGGCAPRTLELGVLDNGTGIIQANHCGVGYNTLALNPVSGTVTINGNTAWHQGNLTNLNQLTNGPGYITSYTETDPVYISERDSLLLNKMVHATQLWSNLSDFNRPSGYSAMIQPSSYQNPVGTHAYFHVIARRDADGGYGVLLQSYNGGEIYHGNTTNSTVNINWYRIWNSSNFNPSDYQPIDADLTAIAALSGTSGFLKKTAANTWSLDTNTYLTSYTETDTLATVTGRGASTSTAVTFSGTAVISTGLAWNNATPALNVGGSGDARIQVRHIWGKEAGTANADHLWLQYTNSTFGVQIGASGGTNPLYVAGNIYMGGYFAGNLVATQTWVTSQGYITGYTETDTLATVTGRGATTTAAISVNSVTGSITSSGSGDSNAPFRFGADYSGWMTIVAGTPGSNNGWGLFWAGNSGAQYGTNGTGGPGDIWTNSSNPNEYVFVGNGQTNMAIHGNTGNVWIAGTLRVAGTITGTLSGNASTASALTSMNISQFTNNSGYITSSGSISGSAGSATQVVTLQDSPPSGVNGQLWFETDTLRLKVYSSAASAWIDSFPMPDMALYYTKAGGAITGSVVIQQDLTVNGQISADGILKMNTTGTSYIRMGRFPASTTNSGEAWIGRASDRSVGTMTVQLGTASDRVFEVVDNPWSTVIFSAGMSSFSYKGNTIWHAGNLTNLNQLTNGPGYITGITSGNVTSALGYTPMYQAAQSGVNVDAFNGTGLYRGSTGDWTNRPTVVHNGGALLQIDTHPGNYHQQLFFDTGGNRLYMRSADAGTWGSWVTMWHSGNLTNLNQLSNGPGYITGITSSMVTTALGYTPYNSTNPNGYITSSGSITGNAATATRLTSVSISNLDTDRSPGTLEYYDKSGGTGAPSNNWHSYISTRHGNSANQYGFQLANQFGTENLFFRGWDGSNPLSWRTIIHSANIGSYALTSLPAHNHDGSAITTGTVANARTTASSSNGSDTIVLRNASGYFDTEGIGINKYLYMGGYRIFSIGNLSANGTQAQRFEIARIGIDYNDWNSVGTFEVELHESYFGQGLKKVYNIWYGYVSNSGIRLVEYRGDGANNFRVTIGAEVTVSGDHRYLPVYVDVGYYGSCHVVIKTNRAITGNSNSAVGAAYIFTSPSGANLSSFTSDSTPEFTTASNAQIAGNTILHAGNYNSYSPTLTGGGASGTWGINITGSAGSASSASTATSATQVVTIQDAPPSGANGKLWWESDTGRLKVYYSAASAWVDATAIPDMSLYYPKAGGSITGDVTVQQTLNVIGNTLFQANSVIQGNLTIQGQLAGVTMSGPIRRNAHANGFLEGSYNNVGGNSYYTNPIYTIGSSYNPSDSSLSNMYGVGYSHPNFWGSGKTSSWGLYVCEAGTINATIGGGSTTIWAQNDIVAYSDARVKDNIEVVENAVEKIQAIRGVTFTRTDANEKDRNKRHAGVIAQEVLKVLPEVVSGTEEDMYSVAYGNMAALFIEAIKEQQVQISELKNLVDKLTDKLNN